MEKKITLELTAEELQLVINALEILSPDEQADRDRLHELYCRLVAKGASLGVEGL